MAAHHLSGQTARGVSILVCATLALFLFSSRAAAETLPGSTLEKPATDPALVPSWEGTLEFSDADFVLRPNLRFSRGATVAESYFLTISIAGDAIFTDSNWEVSRPSATELHLRPKGTTTYWKIDLGLRSAFLVREGLFGTPNASGGEPLPSKVEVGPKIWLEWGEPVLRLSLGFASLAVRSVEPSVILAAGGISIPFPAGQWTLASSGPNAYAFAGKAPGSSFLWEVDIGKREVRRLSKPSGKGPLPNDTGSIGAVVVPWPRAVTEQATGIAPDWALGRLVAKPGPPSAWYEAEKEIYRDLLRHRNYDVLVAPFQVSGYAVDRSARSLMARYLAARIAASGAKVAPVTLASRALGETARVLDENDVLRLATECGARLLIRGYAGHDRMGRLGVTLLVQERNQRGEFAPPQVASWNSLAFTDENPPEEAFRAVVDEALARLPLPRSPREELLQGEFPPPLSWGENPWGLVSAPDQRARSPLERAQLLQFLGALVPAEGPKRGDLFERSLVALLRVPPDAPGYRLLRARALASLHRRPAAVAALGDPHSPTEEALAAYLEGDLPELVRLSATIVDPVLKFLAAVDLEDLSWAYGREPGTDELEGFVAGLPEEWRPLAILRLRAGSRYVVPLEILTPLVRHLLPVEPPSGGGPLPERAVSLRNLLRGSAGDIFADDDAAWAVRRDLLDLLIESDRALVWKRALSGLNPKSLPANALAILAAAGAGYEGHPDFSFLRAEILGRLQKERQLDPREIEETYVSAVFWWGGQHPMAGDQRITLSPPPRIFQPGYRLRAAYGEDWPHQPGWPYGLQLDRTSLDKNFLTGRNATAIEPDLENATFTEQSLLYSLADAGALASYLNAIEKKGGAAARDRYLAKNKHRFRGHPYLTTMLADRERRSGRNAEFIQRLEEAIRSNPEIWRPYLELGRFWLTQGDAPRAAAAFARYPRFRSSEKRDPVTLANEAFLAGLWLWRLGEAELARPFFETAAGAGSGAEAEIFAEAEVAILDDRFTAAKDAFIRAAERYKDEEAIGYAAMLHTMLDEPKRAEELLARGWGKKSPHHRLWWASLVAQRRAGTSDQEDLEWFRVRSLADQNLLIEEPMYVMFFLDRNPEPRIPELIREVWESCFRINHPSWKGDLPSSEKGGDQVFTAYQALLSGDYIRAAELFGDVSRFTLKTSHWKIRALPWAVWAAAKTGRAQEAEQALERSDPPAVDAPGGDAFLLAKALLRGFQGDSETALGLLAQVRWNLPNPSSFDFHPFYRLVESCEWLFAETKDPRYRERARDYARAYRRSFPMYAWAWAVEARFTEDPDQRRRALGTALFLDPRSARANVFPEEEKSAARAWALQNPPFRPEAEPPLHRMNPE